MSRSCLSMNLWSRSLKCGRSNRGSGRPLFNICPENERGMRCCSTIGIAPPPPPLPPPPRKSLWSKLSLDRVLAGMGDRWWWGGGCWGCGCWGCGCWGCGCWGCGCWGGCWGCWGCEWPNGCCGCLFRSFFSVGLYGLGTIGMGMSPPPPLPPPRIFILGGWVWWVGDGLRRGKLIDPGDLCGWGMVGDGKTWGICPPPPPPPGIPLCCPGGRLSVEGFCGVGGNFLPPPRGGCFPGPGGCWGPGCIGGLGPGGCPPAAAAAAAAEAGLGLRLRSVKFTPP